MANDGLSNGYHVPRQVSVASHLILAGVRGSSLVVYLLKLITLKGVSPMQTSQVVFSGHYPFAITCVCENPLPMMLMIVGCPHHERLLIKQHETLLRNIRTVNEPFLNH